MMMQVEHREFILVQAKNAIRPVRSGICIALHPNVLVVGGVQVGCERGLSPKSRLCGGQDASCYSMSELAMKCISFVW
jgi:hypothetical protein